MGKNELKAGKSHLGLVITALARSLSRGNRIRFFSSSVCDHRIVFKRSDSLGVVDSRFSIFKIAAFSSLAT